MAKTRVHELAKEFGVESKFVLEKLKEMGEFVKSASSTVEPPVEMRFKKQYGDELKAAWTGLGTEMPNLWGDDFGKFVGAETKRWAEVVKASGVKLD